MEHGGYQSTLKAKRVETVKNAGALVFGTPLEDIRQIERKLERNTTWLDALEDCVSSGRDFHPGQSR